MVSAVGVIGVGVFGAIIGSFLNVVIFRLPRGLSISKPRWSFCPRCEKRIRAHHNLPIIGWFVLRGKCAECGQPISSIYPTIEGLTAFVFVVVWDVLFVAKLVPAVLGPIADWGILLAWLSLFACLLAVSAMDIESYMIDVRVLNFAMVMGVVGHAVWWASRGIDFASPFLVGSDGSAGFPPVVIPPTLPHFRIDALPPSVSVSACAAGLAWVLTALTIHFIRRAGGNEAGGAAAVEDVKVGEEVARSSDQTAYLTGGAGGFRPLPVLLVSALVVAGMIWQMLEAAGDVGATGDKWRGLLSCTALMGVIVISSLDTREADSQIIDEIEAERSEARRIALREFAHFLPALIVGFGCFFYYRSANQLDAPLAALLGGIFDGKLLAVIGGAVFAGAGLVLGAGVGWSVRIGGTLAFGKEAFGSGDIFILAAIGACLGFWGAFYSFFLSVFLALAGVVLTLFFKKSRALPFGPWLTLGAVVYLWMAPTLLARFSPAGRALWSMICPDRG